MKFLLTTLIAVIATTGFCAPTPTTTNAKLKQYITSIEAAAKDAETRASEAEADAEQSRVALADGQNQLNTALQNANTLQTAINTQTATLQTTVNELNAAQTKINSLQKTDNTLKDIIGGEVALIVILLCLWLKVPELSFPWGLIGTVSAPVAAFGLVKLFL